MGRWMRLTEEAEGFRTVEVVNWVGKSVWSDKETKDGTIGSQ